MLRKQVTVNQGHYNGRTGVVVDQAPWDGDLIYLVDFGDDYVWVRASSFSVARPVIISATLNEFLTSSSCKISKWLLSDKKWIVDRMLQVGNYYSVRETEGMISYCPAGREQGINLNGDWVRKGRESIRPGKLLKKLFPEKRFQAIITDPEIETFVNRFKAFEERDKIHFSVVCTAEDITQAYEEGSREELNSCMKNACVGDFYAAMGARLVKAVQNNVLIGRAILWNCIAGDTEITLMDRIYAKDSVIKVFQNYAATQGWWCKVNQNYRDKEFVRRPDGTVGHYNMHIEAPIPEVGFYPYLDTFTYHNGLSFTTVERHHEHRFDRTEGNYFSVYVTTVSGRRIRGEDAIMLDDGSIYHPDEVVTCSIQRRYIPREEALYAHRRYEYEAYVDRRILVSLNESFTIPHVPA